MMDKRIIAFAKRICEELKIEMPEICVSNEGLRGTMLAACSLDGQEIHLKTDEISLDLLFAIAHELRHSWQIRSGAISDFGKYNSANDVDINEYNRRFAEIDANAYAAAIMREAFGVDAQFANLDREIKKAINERMRMIEIERSKNG